MDKVVTIPDHELPPTVSTVYPRSLFLLWGLCTLGLAVMTPSSLTAVLIDRTGNVGGIAAVVFASALAILLLDWFVNDVLPPRYYLRRSRDFRWLWVCCMSIVYWLFGTIALLPGAEPIGSWVLIGSYFAVGAWGMNFAWHTKVARYRATMAAKCG